MNEEEKLLQEQAEKDAEALLMKAHRCGWRDGLLEGVGLLEECLQDTNFPIDERAGVRSSVAILRRLVILSLAKEKGRKELEKKQQKKIITP